MFSGKAAATVLLLTLLPLTAFVHGEGGRDSVLMLQ